MPHFAKLNEQNIVIFVTVGRDEDEGKEVDLSLRTGETYKQTSYNTYGGVHYTNGSPSQDQSKAFRKNYAGLGYVYDEQKDAFIAPKPFASWVLNNESCLWEAPVELPSDGKQYYWDEDTLSWLQINKENV